MIFCFTTSTKPVSRMITMGLGEDCSHFALVFDETPEGYGLVLHSSLGGVQLAWWGDFRDSHKIVHALAPKEDLSLLQQETFFRAIITRFHGQAYDYPAFAFFAWRAFLYRCFGVPFPARNHWGSDQGLLCTGVGAALRDPVFDVLKLSDLRTIPDLEMVSPHRLYAILKKSPRLRDAPEWTQAPSKSLSVAS